jgi:phenylpropionate dioxygenase-like ring-hydroxylating dioxygenase large terminal subunit
MQGDDRLRGRPTNDDGTVTRRVPLSPPDREQLGAVLRPLGQSFALPGAAYTSKGVYAWEMEAFFGSGWVCLRRSADLAHPGDQAAVAAGDDRVLLVRGDDGTLRGFFNVCRHRGHELLEVGGSATRGTIQCPYHAWAYRLDGRLLGAPGYGGLDPVDFGLAPALVEEWHGWAFANPSGDAVPLADWVGNLEELVRPHEPERLVTGATRDYVVAANWKVIHENYQECYHCSNIHPELCRVTPPDSGVDLVRDGLWAGGSMDLRPNAATMSLTGRSGATPLRGLDDEQRRRVYYCGLFPNLLISLHPDYVLTHLLRPLGPAATALECRWLFQPEDLAADDFDPGYAVEFWDLTNRQDWAAVESVQRGAASRGYRPGPLSEREGSVRQFDTIVTQGYLTGRPLPSHAAGARGS